MRIPGAGNIVNCEKDIKRKKNGEQQTKVVHACNPGAREVINLATETNLLPILPHNAVIAKGREQD